MPEATQQFPQLTSAPIVEALIDIRTDSDLSVHSDEFSEFCRALDTIFPTREEAHVMSAEFVVKGQASHQSVSRELKGFVFKSESEKEVALVTPDGFTYSQLAPYKDWKTLRSDTKMIWDAFHKTLAPTRVTQLSVRYINRLSLTESALNLSQTLKTYPETGDSISDQLEAVFMKLALKDPITGVSTTISQVSQHSSTPSTDESTRYIILDIDSSYERKYEPGSDEMWKALDTLRDVKNKCFFGSITDATLERYR